MYSHEKVNFPSWILSVEPSLQPPVCNALLYQQSLQTMIVGGPNTRSDYHTNLTEEWFYQLKGPMVLKIVDHGTPKDILIKEGEHFFLPGNTPHSPQRFKNTIGLVMETSRPSGWSDSLSYYCKCGNLNFIEKFECTDLVKQLPPVINAYYGNEKYRTCPNCGEIDQKPTKPCDIPDKVQIDDKGVGIDYPAPAPIINWLNSVGNDDIYHGMALHIDKLRKNDEDDKTNESTQSLKNGVLQQVTGERWVYAHTGTCNVELYTENGMDSEKVVELGEGDCILIAPQKYHKITVSDTHARVIICTHIPIT